MLNQLILKYMISNYYDIISQGAKDKIIVLVIASSIDQTYGLWLLCTWLFRSEGLEKSSILKSQQSKSLESILT